MHYYSHNIGDYRRDTAHLTLLEHGVYRQMLDFYYLNELPLTSDEAKLMRSLCVRSADEMQAMKNVLEDFFELTSEGYIHKRCDKVIAAFHGKSEKAAQSAKARWAAVAEEKDANAMRSHTEGNANHKPITNNHKPIKTLPKAAPSVDPVFEEIWKTYPKRPGASKADTLKAYKARLAKDVDAALMLKGAKDYANYCKVAGIDPQYIKQPATFFGPNEHFLSDWTPPAASAQVKELPLATDAQIEHAYRVECGGDPTQARFGSYMEMRKFIVDRREKRRVGV